MGTDFFQWYPLTEVRPGSRAGQSLTLRHSSGEYTLDPSSDFISLPVGDGGSHVGSAGRCHGRRGRKGGCRARDVTNPG